MSITVVDNFKYLGSKPLDSRTKYDTVSDMVNVSETSLYDGCEAYVTATKKYYSYDSSNTTDSTLGKWRERAGGSGGGSGSATVLTQTLTAGSTSVTFSNIPTTGNYIVDFYTSTGINYTAIAPAAGSVTLTFEEQSSNVTVYCEVKEVS